ncbi:hypothetical protein OIU84_015488 [Salix udensis]|uniref:Uncharacterized protein n=1 Tax=Salix udensis TaxID=889485 RepID=A0AAD6J6K5_9ROSI|nr:hypothetical protein OIU84_015488 [Salix udensis]
MKLSYGGGLQKWLIKQFLKDVYWGELDFLVVDAPPGTSDEHISIVQYLQATGIDGAIIVTTPQQVSLIDVRKEVSFCKKVGVEVLGVVENMSGLCQQLTDFSAVFDSSGGGATQMCQEMGVPFLGKLPLDPQLCKVAEEGRSFFADQKCGVSAPVLKSIIEKLLVMNQWREELQQVTE